MSACLFRRSAPVSCLCHYGSPSRGWTQGGSASFHADVKEALTSFGLNASGVRDTARVLHISTDTVLNELRKKEAALESVNTALLRSINTDEMGFQAFLAENLL